MRIAILCCEPEGNGTPEPAHAIRLAGLAGALSRAGHDVVWIGPGGADAPATELPRRQLRQPVSAREIDWHFSQVQPDLVIERLVPGCVDGARVAGDAGIPHVFDAAEDFDADVLASSPSIRGGLPEALALTSAVIVGRDAVASRVKRLARAALPVLVVPDGVEPSRLAPPPGEEVERLARELRLSPATPRVGFFGDLDAGCGLLTAIEAVAALADGAPVQLVVAGDGRERNAGLASAHGARVGLVLCGGNARRRVAQHLALCDVVIVAGAREMHSPQALLEAMALGRAVVVPDSDATRAVARDGREALLVPPDDPIALARALRDLLADGDLRRRLGSHARAVVRERHTWDRRAAQLTELLGAERPNAAPASWTCARGAGEARAGAASSGRP